MGWFSSTEDDNNEAYAEGHEDGSNAGIIEEFVHDIGNAIESNFGERSSSEQCYDKGWDEGSKSK